MQFLRKQTIIESLEMSNVVLVVSINLIDNTIVKLRKVPGEHGSNIKTNINRLQRKNQGLEISKNVA